MADRTARVELSVTGQSKVRASMRGVVKDASDAQRDVLRATKQAEQQKQRELQKTAREDERLQTQTARAALRSIRDRRSAEEKAARDREREIQRISREEEKSSRAVQRNAANRFRRNALMTAGGALAGGSEVLGRVRSFQGVLGLQSPEALAASALDVHRSAVQVGHMAGMTHEQRAGMEKRVYDVAASTGKSPEELMEGLRLAQDKFPGIINTFLVNLESMAKGSVATGTEFKDIVGSMGVMRRQFQLTDDEMLKLGPIMIQMANAGSISFENIAKDFGGALGNMARNAGLHGIGGAQKALVLSQAMGELDVDQPGSGSETANKALRGITALNDKKTREALWKHYRVNVSTGKGGDISGALRDPASIVQDLVKAGFMDASNTVGRQADIKNARGRVGVEGLVDVYKKNPKLIKALNEVTPEQGQAFVNETVGEMNEGVYGDMSTAASRQKKQFIEGGGMGDYAKTMTDAAIGLGKLEAQFPIATDALKTFAATLGGVGGGGIVGSLLGGAGMAAGSAGATALAGAAASFGTIAAATLIGAGIGVSIGNAIVAAIENYFHKDFGQLVVDATDPSGGPDKRTRRGAAGADEERVYATSNGLKPGSKPVRVELGGSEIDMLGRSIARNMRPESPRRLPGGPSAR